jgi:hypothetical protein
VPGRRCTLLVCLLLAGLSPAAASTWTFGPYTSVQVNTNPFGENIPGDAANEPSIAMDPANPARLVIGFRRFPTAAFSNREAGYAYSPNGGVNWVFPGAILPGLYGTDPCVQAGPAGAFYYLSLRQNSACQVYQSFDQGQSWPVGAYAYGGEKPWMAVDRTGGTGHGQVYLAWSTEYGCCGPDTFTRSSDGCLSWLPPVSMPASPIWGTIAVGPEGEVYIAGRSPFTAATFYVEKSTNARDPAEVPSFTSRTVNLGGTLHATDGPNPGGLLSQVWVACDTSSGPFRGSVYVLAGIDPPGPDPMNIHFIRSTDGGQSWSDPIAINDDAGQSTNAWQWFPTLAVAPNGRLFATWNDTRNSGLARVSEVFYSTSANGGATWEPNLQVSPAWDSHIGWPGQQKIGDYCQAVALDDAALLAYAATYNGEQDVYFLRIPLDTTCDCNEPCDCNGNCVDDGQDILVGTSVDFNGDGIPDSCQGFGDMNCDGRPDALDIGPFVQAMIDPAGYLADFPNCEIFNADIDKNEALDADDFQPFATLLTNP